MSLLINEDFRSRSSRRSRTLSGGKRRDCAKRPLINRLIYHISTFHRPAYGSAFAIFPRRSFK